MPHCSLDLFQDSSRMLHTIGATVNTVNNTADLRRRTRKSSRESVSMACPSSPDPSSYSLSDILPSSTILEVSTSPRLFPVNLQHKTCFRVFHYRKAKKSGWNSFISWNLDFKHEIKHVSLCVHVRKFEFPAKTGPKVLFIVVVVLFIMNQ